MKKILIYNLDHDFSLGDNSENYTPTLPIRKMRNIYACFPALYADNGDYILYLDSESCNLPDKENNFDKGYNVFNNIIVHKNLSIITLKELSNINYSNVRIQPWGWNKALISTLKRYGVPESSLPLHDKIASFREASSRLTSSRLFREIISDIESKEKDSVRLNSSFFNHNSLPGLKNIFSEFDEIIATDRIDHVISFYETYGNIYVKAPWSSSGRGLIFTDELNAIQVKQWASGIIRKQGYVVMEKAYNRVADFSTEWQLGSTGAEFIGYGMFNVSSRGKYHSSIVDTSDNLKNRIKHLICKYSGISETTSDYVLDMLVIYQQKLIEKYFAEFQLDGLTLPLGIDMFLTEKGCIHPCVEVNLRNTMGHVALSIQEQILKCDNMYLNKELSKFVKGNELSLPRI